MLRACRRIAGLALLLIFAVDAASAAPTRLARGLRAAACCAGACARLHGVVCEGGCCPATNVGDGASGATATIRDRSMPAIAPVGVFATAVLAVTSRPGRYALPSALAGDDPPPTFLLNRALRL